MSEGFADYYRQKTVLVTGGAGAIGSNLVRRLVDFGAARVLILDDLSASAQWNTPSYPQVLFLRGSVTDDIDLKRVFNEGPEIVFHLAAFFANQNSIDYPERDLWINGMGTLKVLEYARLARVEKLVYASSEGVYGAQPPIPIPETYMTRSLSSPYQITKGLGEFYVNFFQQHYQMQTVTVRFFNNYGPGEIPGQYRNVIPNFIYWAMKGLPLPIAGDGEDTRDYTYVNDTVEGALRAGAVAAAVGEEFNLATGRETGVAELASVVNQITNNNAGVTHVPRRTWDTKLRIAGCIDKAVEILGYAPSVSLREGVELTANWFQSHWELIDRSASFPPGVPSAVRGFHPSR